jgi:hypothetical protein
MLIPVPSAIQSHLFLYFLPPEFLKKSTENSRFLGGIPTLTEREKSVSKGIPSLYKIIEKSSPTRRRDRDGNNRRFHDVILMPHAALRWCRPLAVTCRLRLVTNCDISGGLQAASHGLQTTFSHKLRYSRWSAGRRAYLADARHQSPKVCRQVGSMARYSYQAVSVNAELVDDSRTFLRRHPASFRTILHSPGKSS